MKGVTHLNAECMTCDQSVIAGGQVVYLLSPLRHHRSTLTLQLLVWGQARPSTLLQSSEGKRTDEKMKKDKNLLASLFYFMHDAGEERKKK